MTEAKRKTPKPRTALAILKAARKLLSKRKHWIKGRMAVDSAKHSRSPCEPEAVAWCAVGALRKVSGHKRALNVAHRGLEANLGRTLVGFNDAKRRQHREILALFDRTIRRAKAGA